MCKFKIGDQVINTNNEEAATVSSVVNSRGRVIYGVVYGNGEHSTVLEQNLRADSKVYDPFERCKKGLYSSYEDFLINNTTFKIKNSNNSTISSLKASKTLFRPYQFKPLLKFLTSTKRRLLVADEVGLGKTIEAGHILLELRARRELGNALIVCPKSLQEKWRTELEEKFALKFKIVEHACDLINDLQSFSGSVRAIVNYEKIEMPKYTSDADKQRKEKTNLITYLETNNQCFSMVLCDEAHHLRNPNTRRYKGAEVLMKLADSALFLTATPVMMSDKDLYSLLHLLDNTRYFNYEIFTNRMEENRPFVKALSELNRGTALTDLAVNLILDLGLLNSFIKRTYSVNYSDDPTFMEILKLCSENQDNAKTRARLQYLLSSMSMINNDFSRTRKRDVTTDMSQPKRVPHLVKVTLTPEERFHFDKVVNLYSDGANPLDLMQKKRMVASSVWGFLNSQYDLDRGTDAFEERDDAKFNELLKVIDVVFSHGSKKLVVFALFINTLKYLQIRLSKAGYKAVVVHGQVKNRDEVIHQFRDDKGVQILLSSEVSSVGLDFQFCNSLVNYDLPWNPMVVEQRIGRIDRFGQKSPVVNIYNFVVEGSIQEQIYSRLLERIGIFKGTIGDIEAILDAPINNEKGGQTIKEVYSGLEKELYTKDLTPEERERKIEFVAQAIDNENETLQHLKDELDNSLTNDAYFRDEVNRILHNNSYVTKLELSKFVLSILRQHLTTCSMEEIEPDVWLFSNPARQPKALINFLFEFCARDSETQASLSQFQSKIDGLQEFLVTFDQNVAFENSQVFYINIYHPLIQACMRFFAQHADDACTTYSYALSADELLQSGDRFCLGLYEVVTTRNVHGVQKSTSELMPALFNLQSDTIENRKEIVEHIYSCSQVCGVECDAAAIDAASADVMCVDFAEYVDSEIKAKKAEEYRRKESDRSRSALQTTQYYDSNIAYAEQELEKYTNLCDDMKFSESHRRGYALQKRLWERVIEKYKQECDERLSIINAESPVLVNARLLSLSIITIN